MKSQKLTLLVLGFFLSLGGVSLSGIDDDLIADGEEQELSLRGVAAPAGYLVLENADLNSKVLKRVDKPGVVMVKMRKRKGNAIFYVSDWSWLRTNEGKRANYIYIIPQGASELEAADPEAYWSVFYEQLKCDNVMRNCSTAYDFFAKQVAAKDPFVLRFIDKKFRSGEPDPQARGCMATLVCQSAAFKHDTFLAKQLIALLREHQQYRPNAMDNDYGTDTRWDFVGYPGSLNHTWVCFLIRNAPKYEDVLVETMLDPKADIMLQWLCIHALARHKLLDRYENKFKASFFRQMFTHLRDDHRRWNGEWSTRILTILRRAAGPHIKQRLLERGMDEQEQEILRMLDEGILLPKNQAVYCLIGNLQSQFFGPDETGFEYELDLFR